ncbi:cytochrome P450 [Ramaria rubella]|nr:cytochrome P450 [Ramaria rubella]
MFLQAFVLEQPYMASFILCLAFFFFYTILGRLHGSPLPRAPRVEYFLPWIGSALQIRKDPDNFLRRASSKLGPIFRIKAAGQEMTWVTSPELISAIYRDPKSFEFLPVRLGITESAFGLPHDLVRTRFYAEDHLPIYHEELSPKNILNFAESYAKNAHAYLSQALEKFDGSCTEPMSFMILPAYLAAATTFFGTAFEAEKSYKGFKTFDDQFHVIVTELPNVLMLRAEASARDAGWSDREIAAELGGQLWALQANSIFAAYWVLALMLQQPEGLAALIAEVDQARVDWKTQHPDHLSYENQHQWVLDVTLPHLISAIQEALRFASSSFSQRRVSKPTDFGGFHFEPGELIVCATRSVHIDDEIHPNPQEFDSKRYMSGQNKFRKNGKIVPNHFLPFGGGISMCEGRHFVMGELKIFLASMMTCVTIELNPNSNARPKFITERMGAGIMHPSGDLSIKISKRKD